MHSYIFDVGYDSLLSKTLSLSLVTKLYLTLASPLTVACQAPLSTGFSRQEHWSGLPFPSPGDLPDPRTKPGSPALQADSLLTKLWGKPSKTLTKAKPVIYVARIYQNIKYPWSSIISADSSSKLAKPVIMYYP